MAVLNTAECLGNDVVCVMANQIRSLPDVFSALHGGGLLED